MPPDSPPTRSGPKRATTKEDLQEATEMAAYWLHLGNLASERGEKELAERHYARSQKWHDKMNDLLEDE